MKELIGAKDAAIRRAAQTTQPTVALSVADGFEVISTASLAALERLAGNARDASLLDVDRLVVALRAVDQSIATAMGDDPRAAELVDPADEPVRREYAVELARVYNSLADRRG